MRSKKLLLCIGLLMAVCYELVVAKPVQAQLAENQQKLMELEDQLKVEQYRSEKKDQMLKRLQQEGGPKKGELYLYDNLLAEMQELEQTLSAAGSSEIQIAPVTISGSIVQREVTVSFETGTYDEAYRIIEEIEYGPFCCTVRDIGLSASEPADGQERISVRILVTYYERQAE